MVKSLLQQLLRRLPPRASGHHDSPFEMVDDATGAPLDALRLRALEALNVQPGETVFDVGCGTGPLLPALARRVQENGWVVGIECSPHMAEHARRRVEGTAFGYCVQVDETSAERFETTQRADAMIFSFAHDVLLSPDALNRLIRFCKPRARIAIVGLKTLPWWWGGPLNTFNLYRARKSFDTWMGLDRPWSLLEGCGAELRQIESAWCGNLFIAIGQLGDDIRDSPNPPVYAPALFEPLFIPSSNKRESK